MPRPFALLGTCFTLVVVAPSLDRSVIGDGVNTSLAWQKPWSRAA